MSEVVGIGACVYDMLMYLDDYPEEDTKLRAAGTRVSAGGPCATALAACARLGISGKYIGCLGDDAYGAHLLQSLARCGIDTGQVRIVPERVSWHSVVLVNRARATRTCVWSSGDVPELVAEDVDVAAVRSARALHMDGNQIEAAVFAAKLARECGVKVSLDAGAKYSGIERLLPLVDFLIPSEEFALSYTGASDAQGAAERLYERFKPEVVIVTRGAEGGVLFDGKCSEYHSFKVAAVDSNGAGDVFHGAFLAGYLRGMAPPKAARFASAVAALKCMGHYAWNELPDFEDTINFLRRNNCEKL